MVICLAATSVSTAQDHCQVGCTCGDPSCTCGLTGVPCSEPSTSSDQQAEAQQAEWQSGANAFLNGPDSNGGNVVVGTQSGITIGVGTPQSGVPIKDPALREISNQIEVVNQEINNENAAYQQGKITYSEWWEFRHEEAGSVLWLLGQFAAIARSLGELSADSPIEATAPRTNTGAGQGVNTEGGSSAGSW